MDKKTPDPKTCDRDDDASARAQKHHQRQRRKHDDWMKHNATTISSVLTRFETVVREFDESLGNVEDYRAGRPSSKPTQQASRSKR